MSRRIRGPPKLPVQQLAILGELDKCFIMCLFFMYCFYLLSVNVDALKKDKALPLAEDGGTLC